MWLVHLSSCRQTVNRIFCRLQRYSPGQCLLASRISCKCTLLLSKIATSKATANIKHINEILKHKSNISKGNHKEKSISLQGNTLKLSGFLPPKPLPMQRSLGRQHSQNSVCEDITIFFIQRIWTLISRGREIIVFLSCVNSTQVALQTVRDNAKYSSVFGLQSYGHLSSVFIYRMMGLCVTCAWLSLINLITSRQGSRFEYPGSIYYWAYHIR